MNNSLLYLITVLIWGSTWIAINYQLGDVSHEASLSYRFGLAALLLLTYCKFNKLSLRFNARQHLQLLLFGMTLFSCNYYLLYNAQQYINSALTCIAFSFILFVNIINARIWYHTKITVRAYLGGAIGIVGIITLFWPQVHQVSFDNQAMLGLILCFIATLFASTGNMLSIRNQKQGLALLPATCWGMFYGALFMALMNIAQGKSFDFSMTFSYISSLLYLAVFGSVIAFSCYLTLLNNIGAHKASYSTIMFPAVAVVISSFVEDFQWSSFTLLGLLLILIGNIIVLTPTKVLRRVSIRYRSSPNTVNLT